MDIREGIDKVLNSEDGYIEGDSDKIINNLLQYLHSQGIVRKVGRELPTIEEVFLAGGVPDEFAKGMNYYRCFLIGSNYIVVEPLVESAWDYITRNAYNDDNLEPLIEE